MTVIATMVVAADLDDCIGRRDKLPWKIPGDLRNFRMLTSGGICIMGSRTYASIRDRLGHALPNRVSVVVTRRTQSGLGRAVVARDPEQALSQARAIAEVAGKQEVFVIGGATVYAALLPEISRVHLTRVQARVHGDKHLPKGWLRPFELWQTETLRGRQDKGDEFAYDLEHYGRR